jgi:hypothetical protein
VLVIVASFSFSLIINSADLFFFSGQDADGKITTEDAKYYWRKFKEIMVTRLPGGAGFAGGFFFGVKHG